MLRFRSEERALQVSLCAARSAWDYPNKHPGD
uniref:Uncharacterized protein n=1 Tax=Zea mays TaxID=4577 RepID=C0PLA0_MAIZE|nr:unknown [Zea mays]